MREITVAVGALPLDCGETLPAVEQRVTIYGSETASKTVLINHALTGSSRIAEWWPEMIGERGLFDQREWRVIGIDALVVPRVTVRDMVRAQRRALDQLGVERLDAVIGGSLGGMQALQWALDAPTRVGHAIVIGAHDHHSAMGIAFNSVQRDAIALDPVRGLGLARKIAMLTYKSEELFNQRHGRNRDRHGEPRFDIEGYLARQAATFDSRLSPETYTTLTHAMDSFEIRDGEVPCHPELVEGNVTLSRVEGNVTLSRVEGNVTLSRVEGNVTLSRVEGRPVLTFVGISSDWLFRPQDVRAAAERFKAAGWRARHLDFESHHGHDAFLAEAAALAKLLRYTLNDGSEDCS